jgi:hypothetical protein
VWEHACYFCTKPAGCEKKSGLCCPKPAGCEKKSGLCGSTLAIFGPCPKPPGLKKKSTLGHRRDFYFTDVNAKPYKAGEEEETEQIESFTEKI